MVHIGRMGMKHSFPGGFPFHFAITIKGSTLIDSEHWGDQCTGESACGMDLNALLCGDLSLHAAIDDYCDDSDSSHDDSGLPYDECTAFEYLSLKSSIKTEHAL